MDRFILHEIYGMSAEDRKRFDLGEYADDGSLLEDTVTGETYMDGWEPEDATFVRDLGWVPALLNELAEETATARQERDEARAALARADEQSAEAIERVSKAIVADKWNSAAALQEEVKRLTSVIEGARLILAAEQGRTEGAPSEGWAFDGRDWNKNYPDGSFAGVSGSRGKRSWMRALWPDTTRSPRYLGRGYDLETDRAAMIAADAASTPALPAE